jgi:RNA polymerase sigma factor (sigma-70 family)
MVEGVKRTGSLARSCRQMIVASMGGTADVAATPPGSFDAFFDANYERLGKALYLVTGDPVQAEDLAQDAMLRVYERWDRVAGMASPTGYLYRTALNLHRSAVRRTRVRLRRRPRVDGTDPLQAVEDRDDIGRLLRAIPETQRAAVVLVEWLGMTAEEAGEVLGIEAVSVRVRISRAKAALRARGVSEGEEMS